MPERVQRLRVHYGCDEALKHIGHLDQMQTWERILRRARTPVLYSEGFSPRPRIALAAPLPVGVSSEAEQLDVVLSERVEPAALAKALRAQLPDGLRVLEVEELPLDWPSLQSLVRAAAYEVVVEDGRSAEEWRAAIDVLLARESIPWEQQRGEKVRRYDLRPLILSVELREVCDGVARLWMRLRHDEQGAGRPEQVAKALGAESRPRRLHRLRLELAEGSER